MLTFDEEPTRYDQEAISVVSEKVRATDRFQHRSQGWVTVTGIRIGHKNVTFEYTRDRDGGSAETTAPIGFNCPIIRQTQTDAWTLWHAETELEGWIAEATSDAAVKARAAKIRKAIEDAANVVNERTQVGDLVRRLIDVVPLEVNHRLWHRLNYLLEKEPAEHQLGCYIPGDIATTVLYLVDDVINDILVDVRVSYRTSDAELAAREALAHFARGHGQALMHGRVVRNAQDVVRFREKLGFQGLHAN